jgi:perosamine synthetase
MNPVPAVPMPLSVQDLREACRAGEGAREQLAEACRTRYGARAAYAVSSGRAALWLALRALQTLRPQRRTVILPAYTCPTVGRAVQAAGLQGLAADVSLTDWGLDPTEVGALLDDSILAVIAPHLFGTACQIAALRDLCRQAGVWLIEDLAQACGAQCRGQAVGAFGDLAFNSLGRSKNIRGGGGGVLWVNNPELTGAVAGEYAALPEPNASALSGQLKQLATQLKQLATILLSRPQAWQVVRRLPFLEVGREDQEFDEQPTRLAGWQAALGSLSLSRVEAYNALRQGLGRQYGEALAGLNGLAPQSPAEGNDSTYLRFALRETADGLPQTSVRTQTSARVEGGSPVREKLVERLQRRGVDARSFYSRVIYDYSWWQPEARQKPCPAAATLLRTNLVLPVHYAMTETQIAQIAELLRDGLADGY